MAISLPASVGLPYSRLKNQKSCGEVEPEQEDSQAEYQQHVPGRITWVELCGSISEQPSQESGTGGVFPLFLEVNQRI